MKKKKEEIPNKNFPLPAWSKILEADAITENFLEKKLIRSFVIYAPMYDIVAKLRVKGFMHPTKNRVCANSPMAYLEEQFIVQCYASIIYGLLNFYRVADNFTKVRSLAKTLKLGCLYTLARKHKKLSAWAFSIYGHDASIKSIDGKKIIAQLPTNHKIDNLSGGLETPIGTPTLGLELGKVLHEYK